MLLPSGEAYSFSQIMKKEIKTRDYFSILNVFAKFFSIFWKDRIGNVSARFFSRWNFELRFQINTKMWFSFYSWKAPSRTYLEYNGVCTGVNLRSQNGEFASVLYITSSSLAFQQLSIIYFLPFFHFCCSDDIEIVWLYKQVWLFFTDVKFASNTCGQFSTPVFDYSAHRWIRFSSIDGINK